MSRINNSEDDFDWELGRSSDHRGTGPSRDQASTMNENIITGEGEQKPQKMNLNENFAPAAISKDLGPQNIRLSIPFNLR